MLHRRHSALLAFMLLLALFGTSAARQPDRRLASTPSIDGSISASAANESIELLGTYGGRLTMLDVDGTWLYAAQGGGFAIFDMSDPSQPVRRAFLPLPHAVTVGDYADGLVYAQTAYALYVIDVQNPLQPTIRSTYHLSPNASTQPHDVKALGDKLYVLYEDHRNNFDPNTLLIFDASEPTNLVLLGSFREGLWPSVYEMEVVGSFVYIARATNGLTVIDVSDPANPKHHNTYTTFGRPFQLALKGDTLFVGTRDALLALDVTDPANPVQIGSYAPSGLGVMDLAVVGDRAYIASYDFNPSDLRILNVSDPANMTLIGTYPSAIRRVDQVLVANNHALLATNPDYGPNAIQIVDVSNPTTPTNRHTLFAPASTADVEVAGNLALLPALYDGLFIVDVTDPAQAKLLSAYQFAPGDTSKSAIKVDVAGSFAYLAVGTALQIIDISDPANPTLRGQFPGFVRQVQVIGSRAYLIGGDRAMILDVSNPDLPVKLGERTLNPFYQSGEDLVVAGNMAFLSGGSCADGCRGGVDIVDVSNPASPVLRGSINGPFGDVEVLGNLLYITKQYTWIYDVSNPGSPRLVHTMAMPLSPIEVEIAGQMAYFAGSFTGGIQISDVGVPTVPKLRATHQTSWRTFGSRMFVGIEVVGDVVYLADAYNGLYILRVHPEQFPSSIFAPVIGK